MRAPRQAHSKTPTSFGGRFGWTRMSSLKTFTYSNTTEGRVPSDFRLCPRSRAKEPLRCSIAAGGRNPPRFRLLLHEQEKIVIRQDDEFLHQLKSSPIFFGNSFIVRHKLVRRVGPATTVKPVIYTRH